MSNVVAFLPKTTLKRQKALDALVEHYRAFMQTPLENPMDHRGHKWIWGSFKWNRLGRFMKFEYSYQLSGSHKKIPPEMALPDKTLGEIQALILHYVITHPNRGKTTYIDLLRALLLVEKVLRDRSPTGLAVFADLKASDLDNSLSLSSMHTASGNALYPDRARDILVELGVVTSSATKNWVNANYRKRLRANNQSNRSLDSDNYKKLPNMQGVAAAAEYFADQPWLTRGEDPNCFDTDQRNICISAILAMLSLAPARIQEILKNLPANCLVRQPESTVGEVLGIHWYSDKTDMSQTKWIPYTPSGEFEEVIEEVVARLKHVTEDARTLLRTWDSECPEFDEEQYLKAERENRLPKGWPYFEPKLKLRYSDAMFVCLKYQMNTVKKTIHNRVEIISYDKFRDWLRTKVGFSRWSGQPIKTPGFFDRIGYGDLELALDDYNSHSFRHMVNTAARLGGMSEFDVNMWSHRKQPGQGEVYNHATGEQRRNLIVHNNHKARELSPEERLNHINHGMPMTRKNLGMKFELIGNSYGGFTFNHPLGSCIHNYAESPCMKNMDCIMCPENLHCKGDKRTLKNLREELEQANSFLKVALLNKDRMGANRFEMRSEVLTALVNVLGDDSPLADGDLVILSPEQLPSSGLLERAKLAAEHIKKHKPEIENRYGRTKAALGVNRCLPGDDNEFSQKDDRATHNFDSLVDDFLLGFEDED